MMHPYCSHQVPAPTLNEKKKKYNYKICMTVIPIKDVRVSIKFKWEFNDKCDLLIWWTHSYVLKSVKHKWAQHFSKLFSQFLESLRKLGLICYKILCLKSEMHSSLGVKHPFLLRSWQSCLSALLGITKAKRIWHRVKLPIWHHSLPLTLKKKNQPTNQ